jgi:hypothetical protein
MFQLDNSGIRLAVSDLGSNRYWCAVRRLRMSYGWRGEQSREKRRR